MQVDLSFDHRAPRKSQATRLRQQEVIWVGFLTDQINPLIANVVVNLSKGAVSAAPIQVQNVWHIIKVDDIRNFVVPKFDDAKGQIRQALQMRQLSEYVSQIILAAKVQLADW